MKIAFDKETVQIFCETVNSGPEKIKKATEAHFEALKEYHKYKLNLEFEKAERIIEMETELDENTSKKKFSNADLRNAELLRYFKEQDIELLSLEGKKNELKMFLDYETRVWESAIHIVDAITRE